jgi:hypothetical protein
MRDLMRKAYDQCPVGDTRTVSPDMSSPDMSRGETLKAIKAFEVEVSAAYDMQEQGLISIKKEPHRESESGKRLIDAITFVRLK